MTPRIAIVGAGAVGGYIGAHLSRCGEDVCLIDHYPEHVERMRCSGLKITGVDERDHFSVGVKALHVCDVQRFAFERPIDYAFIAVKGYDTNWATSLIEPYLASDGCALSFQNGLNDAAIAAIVGDDRTCGVIIAGCGAILHEPGAIRRTNGSPETEIVFRVGELDGRKTDRVDRIVRILSHADRSGAIENLVGERWSKLVVNAMRMGLAVITNIYIPEQDRNAITRAFMIQVGAEVAKLGHLQGLKLEKIQGIPPDILVEAGRGDVHVIEKVTDILLEGAKRFADNSPPSMAQDIAKGRRTECDSIYGFIVDRGRELGQSTPFASRIRDLVIQIERKELQPSLSHVCGL